MSMLVALLVLLALVAVPVVRAIRNPVVTVADEQTAARSFPVVDAEVAALLAGARGYDLRLVVPGTYTLSYRRTPAWALVLALLTFPIGLLLVFLARETFTLTISVTAVETGTRVLVVGRAHTNVALAVGAGLDRRLRGPVAASAASG